MATRIVMPTFGMYTAEGTLARWLRAAGERVEAGEVIAELSTEKASYELEAPAAGILHQVSREGDPLTVEGLIGWILGEGEAVPWEAPPSDAPPPWGVASGATRPSPADLTGEGEPLPGEAMGRLKASPAARRLATERGVDLATVTGTGPGGRIVETDVLRMARGGARAAVAPVPAPVAPAGTPAGRSEVPWRVRERVPLAGLRRATAERLRRAVDGPIPLTLTREARAGALAEARRGRADSDGVALPWDALFARALGDALRERPELNAVLAGEEILLLDEVHVGFAVSVPDGLVVPVLRDADRRPLAELAADVRALAARARAGALRPEDVLGGTVTLTNLGGHGVDAFTPVLNPPQSAILGVGRLAPRPVVEPGGTLAVAETCVLSLTFDHRVTDGAPAAELLAAVARRLDDRAWWEGVR